MSRKSESRVREDAGAASVIRLDDVRHRKRVEELTRLHGEYLRGLAKRLCRRNIDPEDLVQELFEKTMRAREPVPPGANERAWLSRVLHNLFIDRLRRVAARREDPLEVEPGVPAPDDLAWWQSITADDIRRHLGRFPEDQRVTFELFVFEGKSYDQIAAQLAIAKATVGTRILRVRQRLREVLTAERRDD